MTARPVSHPARRVVIVLGSVLAIFSVLLLSQSERSLADSPSSNRLARTCRRLKARGFIGLPEGNTVSVQSLLPAAADITVTFALSNGAPISTVFDTLAAESFGVYPEPANFTGQARVEATGDIGAGNLPVFGASFGLSDSGNSAYLGMNLQNPSAVRQRTPSPGFTYQNYLPLVMKSYQGWTTVFEVQNFRAFAPASVTISFYDQFGNLIASEVAFIPVSGSQSFNLADLGSIDNGFIGSAVIDSDQPVAPNSARQVNPGRGLVRDYSGAGLSYGDISTTLIAPALFKASNLQTSQLCIQNVGAAASSIGVLYTDGARETALIPALASICLDQGAGDFTCRRLDWRSRHYRDSISCRSRECHSVQRDRTRRQLVLCRPGSVSGYARRVCPSPIARQL